MMLDSSLPEPEPLPGYAEAAGAIREAAAAMRPPGRIDIASAAERWRVLRNQGGGYSGPWRNAATPYMIEPQEVLTDRRVAAVVFCGPAQSAKTSALVLNPILHAALVDPAPILVVHMTQATARDWSARELDKMIRDSDPLAAAISASNVYDKSFGNMRLSLAWPSPTALAGRPVPRVLMTDYDRMPDDVGGEGTPFDLGEARTRTFGSRAYIVAESSPSRPLNDAKWKPATAHEAPAVGGILGLYNRGDRRRWVWPCPDCGEYFEAAGAHMSWPDDPALDAYEIGRAAVMICPDCGTVIGGEHKNAMNAAGRWLPEGCKITADGALEGAPMPGGIRSYWLKGPAAAFSTWAELVTKRVTAERQASRGDEGPLKTTLNVDWADVFTPAAAKAAAAGALGADSLADRAEVFSLGVMPAAARFVTIAIDVQARRFELLARAWAPGGESWIIDHADIFQADDGAGGLRAIDPARRAEDWDLLIDAAFNRVAKIEGRAGIAGILPAAVAIDTGGEAGVTENAYKFYRRWRAEYGRRMVLTKGTGAPSAPRIRLEYPDAQRKDRLAGARGEIPVWLFNSDLLKDALDTHLRVESGAAGGAPAHMPAALLSADGRHEFFEQLAAEIRSPSGKWIKTRPRNEALDLMVMAHAAALALKADRVDWDAPPAWARLEGNPLFIAADPATPGAPGAPGSAAGSETETTPAATPVAVPIRARQAVRPRRGGFVNGWKG